MSLSLSVSTLLLSAGSAFVAGAVNAMAGGGTFITFPVLTGAIGLSAKAANVTSTVGLWPGYAASIAAARDDFRKLSRSIVWGYSLTGLIGGAAGAVLLVNTSVEGFNRLIPWLLLFSTVVLAVGPTVNAWARRGTAQARPKHHHFTAAIFPMLFVVSIYNGYFGAGGGILLLAGMTLTGQTDTHQMNAMKVLIQLTANAAAVVIFLTAGINWPIAAAMALAAAVGGFAGMAFSRKIPSAYVRAIILIIATALTIAYFCKG